MRSFSGALAVLGLSGKLLQNEQTKSPEQARDRSLTLSVNRICKTAMLQEWHCLSAFVSVCHSNHRSEQNLGADDMLGTGNAESPWSRD